MVNVSVSRQNGSLVNKDRSGVVFGEVFSYLGKDGKTKKEKYLHLGKTTTGAYPRLFSIKGSNRELSSSVTTKGTKKVAVIGKFSVAVRRFKADSSHYRTFRAQLKIGDVFRVKDAEYLHLGTLNDGRFFALNIGSQNHATTDNDEKEVTVIGYGKFNATHV